MIADFLYTCYPAHDPFVQSGIELIADFLYTLDITIYTPQWRPCSSRRVVTFLLNALFPRIVFRGVTNMIFVIIHYYPSPVSLPESRFILSHSMSIGFLQCQHPILKVSLPIEPRNSVLQCGQHNMCTSTSVVIIFGVHFFGLFNYPSPVSLPEIKSEFSKMLPMISVYCLSMSPKYTTSGLSTD